MSLLVFVLFYQRGGLHLFKQSAVGSHDLSQAVNDQRAFLHFFILRIPVLTAVTFFLA